MLWAISKETMSPKKLIGTAINHKPISEPYAKKVNTAIRNRTKAKLDISLLQRFILYPNFGYRALATFKVFLFPRCNNLTPTS